MIRLRKPQVLLQKSMPCWKDSVCFAQVLLDDIGDFQAMNEVYGAWVESMEVKPARAAFEAGALPAGAKVEIVVQAIDSN